MPVHQVDSIDFDIIRLALRGDADMRRYVPEVMRLCARLGIDEPPWLQDADVAERVALNRARWPKRDESSPTGGTDDPPIRFPHQPRGAQHLYAVARIDRSLAGADPMDAFVLTRGFWDEHEANTKAAELNGQKKAIDTEYFVLPVRVAAA